MQLPPTGRERSAETRAHTGGPLLLPGQPVTRASRKMRQPPARPAGRLGSGPLRVTVGLSLASIPAKPLAGGGAGSSAGGRMTR